MSDFIKKYESCYQNLDNIVKLHSRTYKQLQTFLLQNKQIQADIYNDFVNNNSIMEGVLRKIIDEDVNRTTIQEHDAEIDEMVRKEEEDFYGHENHNHK